MQEKAFPGMVATIMALFVSACGGADGGGLASAPPPAPVPTPTPSPSPVAEVGSSPLGLVSDRPFATIHNVSSVPADNSDLEVEQTDPDLPLEFRYDSASGKYLITLPGRPEGSLVVTFANEWVSENEVVAATGTLPETSVQLNNPSAGNQQLKFSYTTYGTWMTLTDRTTIEGKAIRDFGSFVYGIPTAPSDVPTSGKAAYSAVIEGGAVFDGPEGRNGQGLFGSVHLDFDFASGGLTGYMEPYISNNGFQPYEGELGRFTFSQTVHAVGSTNFSGAFLSPGLAGVGGEFAGSFNGPQAAELMATFSAPFQADMKLLYDGETRVDRLVGTLSGLWLGRKD